MLLTLPRRWLALFTGAALALAAAPGTAQGWPAGPAYPKPLIAEWQGEFEGMVLDNYRRLFAPVLTPPEAARLRGLRFVFSTDPAAVLMQFQSRSDGVIIMPVASLLLLKDLALAEAWLHVQGYAIASVLDYVGLLRMGRLVSLPENERLPLAALGVPPSAAEDPRVLERRNETLSKMVLFLLGHELGHLLQDRGLEPQARCERALRVPGAPACDTGALQRSEQTADAIAVDLMRRVGLIPNSAAYFFLLNSRLSAAPTEFVDDKAWQAYLARQTHPLDSQRVAHLRDSVRTNRDAFVSALSNPITAPGRIDGLVKDLDALVRLMDDPAVVGLQQAWARTLEARDLKPRRDILPNLRPEAADLAARAPWSGYFSGNVAVAGSGERRAIEILWRATATRLHAEVMLMGIRGRAEGRVPDGTQASLAMDLGGTEYELVLSPSATGAGLVGTIAARLPGSPRSTVELTRVTTRR